MKEQLRTSIRHWLHDPEKLAWFVYGMIAAFVMIGIVTGVVASTGRSIIPPLVRIIPQEIILSEPVCVGDEVTQEITLEARRPTVVDLDSAVYRVDTQQILLGTERSISSPVPQDWDRLPMPIRFTVPDAMQGAYRMVVAVTPKGKSGEVAFLSLFFEIGDC
jgi:hypothetical protein